MGWSCTFTGTLKQGSNFSGNIKFQIYSSKREEISGQFWIQMSVLVDNVDTTKMKMNFFVK
jgi:hypothetical protein